ncbi:STPAP polymerase, partial [Rhodinocichla rosea]|nr:STPAP polymerase [Rhodinocichla rosea]
MEPEPGPGPGPDPDLDPDPDMDPGRDPVPGPGHDPVTGPVPVTDPANDPDVEPLHRGGFRCRLCQINTANLPSLRAHLAGRRHRRLRCLRAERRAQERRSLFVSGFARGTAPEQLRRHFRAFGPVATVVMDKDKFGSPSLPSLALPVCPVCPVWHSQFAQFGSPSLPSLALPVCPVWHSQFAQFTQFPRPQVWAQLQLLVRALELSAAERRLRELLLTLIREVFREFFPGCSVVPYGSSVNGFDVHGCDLDLHLELGEPQSPDTPNGDPQIPETPKGDPQSLRTSNGDPQIPETPNGDPQSLRTSNGDPGSPETPNGDPQIPE